MAVTELAVEADAWWVAPAADLGAGFFDVVAHRRKPGDRNVARCRLRRSRSWRRVESDDRRSRRCLHCGGGRAGVVG